ncbi:hypothetical protein [Gluconacetobacter sp.]|uniref:hypothetical protein n=1 Tax=Gluconacetobacter sp. TaxID=1935994 RepID=UPI0039E9C1AA
MSLSDLPIFGSDEEWRAQYKVLQQDNSHKTPDLECCFRDIKKRLLEIIQTPTYSIVVGCVAWITDTDILEALVQKAGLSLIINKPSHAVSVPPLLRGLTSDICNRIYPDALNWLDNDPAQIGIAPLRCVGYTDGQQAVPRMHNKFLVFCSLDGTLPVPQAVWTGSANFSYNASVSFENAVYIENEEIAQAYFDEWRQITMFSEPIDRGSTEPTYGFRLNFSGITWPQQLKWITLLEELEYRAPHVIERFLQNNDWLSDDIWKEFSDDCSIKMQIIRKGIQVLKNDLDCRHVPTDEFNERFDAIKVNLFSMSAEELNAEFHLVLDNIARDIEEWSQSGDR